MECLFGFLFGRNSVSYPRLLGNSKWGIPTSAVEEVHLDAESEVVDPLLVEVYDSTDDMVWFAVETAITHDEIHHGDTVLVLAGAPDHGRGSSRERPATDVLRLVEVD